MTKETSKKIAASASEIMSEADKTIVALKLMGNTITNAVDLLERAKSVAASALAQVENPK